jgi:hypothetical protein
MCGGVLAVPNCHAARAFDPAAHGLDAAVPTAVGPDPVLACLLELHFHGFLQSRQRRSAPLFV